MTDKIEGYGVGDVSDDLRAWTEQVAALLNALVTTEDIADHAVTYVKLQQMVALSILGNATNATADAAEIAAAADDTFLRRTGSTLNFGALTIGMIADALITYAKLQDSDGVSVLGRSANSTGVLADITAGANDRLLARTADALAFVQLTAGMVPDALITLAMMANLSADTIIGRANGAGTGVPTALTASQVLTILGINLPVEVAPVTLSGTTTNLATGIPSWVSDILVSLDEASTNGTSVHMIQLGTSGGFVTSGYLGGAAIINATPTGTANSDGFRCIDSNVAAANIKGIMRLRRHDSSNNIWVCSGDFARDNGTTYNCAGRIALSGPLTQIRWTTKNGTDTADSGSGAVKYY